jgi:MFS family permease
MSADSATALTAITSAQRRTLIAAALGWMLDAFDVMLYAMVLAHIMRDLGISKGTAGLLNTLTLLASGIGGVLFGLLADRVGRTRALMLSILTYSVCSFASGLATSIAMLAAVRFVLGLGMGGEWNTGATLVAETWPDNLRARALSIVQSSWAIGYAGAALVAGLMLRHYSWRAVFFVGVLPALVTLWIRKDVPESELWQQRRKSGFRARDVQGTMLPASGTGFAVLFSREYVRNTIALLLLNFFGLFAYWGLFSWVPAYLSLPTAQGGRGFGLMSTTELLLVLNLAGMLPGYLCFGWFADHLGRRRAFMLYLFLAACLVPIYAAARSQWLLLLMGALVGFFGTGFFSGSALVGSEIFPTAVRARALGFTYNGARTFSAVAPFVIGRVGQSRGLDWAFYLCAISFLLAGVMAMQLPETRGRSLQ